MDVYSPKYGHNTVYGRNPAPVTRWFIHRLRDYILLFTVFYSYQQLLTGAGFLPSTVGFDPSPCWFHHAFTIGAPWHRSSHREYLVHRGRFQGQSLLDAWRLAGLSMEHLQNKMNYIYM